MLDLDIIRNLNDREEAIMSEAVYYIAVGLRAYDNSNPDVGMGWMDEHYVDQAILKMKTNKNDINYAGIVARMKRD
jgi:hypothetical protein